MKSLPAHEAKTHFEELLLKVQREPVQINHNGKAVAVILSADAYLSLESLKMKYLKSHVEQAKGDSVTARIAQGDIFFDNPFWRFTP